MLYRWTNQTPSLNPRTDLRGDAPDDADLVLVAVDVDLVAVVVHALWSLLGLLTLQLLLVWLLMK